MNIFGRLIQLIYKKIMIVWMQEEPKNAGAWAFVAPRVDDVLARINSHRSRVRYVGAPEMASPAPGSFKRHQELQRAILDEALAP